MDGRAQVSSCGWATLWRKWTDHLRYTAGFINTSNGSRVVVDVPGSFGMHIWSRYSIQDDGQDHRVSQGRKLYFTEEDQSECALGLGKFVKKEHELAHRVIHQAFMETLAIKG